MRNGVAAIAIAALAAGLGAASGHAQETQTDPSPVPSVPQTTPQKPVQPPPPGPATQQPAAPVVRQASHPSATASEPVSGPLTGAASGSRGASGPGTQVEPVNRGGDVETIRVRSRLVNVALNVVDAHGAPVGGFERKDFQLFEDGKPQEIAVFEREATSPLSIVLAIDSSETVLTSDRLEREAAKRFVRAILRTQDEIDLMDFADTVREIVPFTNQAKRIEQGLGELKQGDETALYNAVYLASQRLGETSQEANRRRVLVVISDGGNSLEHGEHYEQAVEQAQRAGAMIYSIIIVPIAGDAGRNTGGEHALIQMSEDTGGKYYYVEDPKDLEPAFQHVSEDLRTQYLLGYYAPKEGGHDPFRRIKVKLADAKLDEKYSVRYRTGYFADEP